MICRPLAGGGGTSSNIDFIKDDGNILYPITILNAIYTNTGIDLEKFLSDTYQIKGSYSLSSHNHDTVYAKIDHTHSNYSLSTHNHDSTYAKVSHTHNYAATSHTHDSRYYIQSEINTKLNAKANNGHEHTMLLCVDSRSDGNLKLKNKGLYAEFKSRTAIGLGGTSSSYAGLLHFMPWQDKSGGHLYELAFSYEGTEPRLHFRSKLIQDGAFNKWNEVYQGNRVPNKINSDISASWNTSAKFEASGIFSNLKPNNGFVNTHTCLMNDNSRMMLGFLNNVLVVTSMTEAGIQNNTPDYIIYLYDKSSKLTRLYNLDTVGRYQQNGINGKIVADQSSAPNTGMIWAW